MGSSNSERRQPARQALAGVAVDVDDFGHVKVHDISLSVLPLL